MTERPAKEKWTGMTVKSSNCKSVEHKFYKEYHEYIEQYFINSYSYFVYQCQIRN